MTALPTSPPGRPSSSLHFAVGELSGKLDQILGTILPQLAALQSADASLDLRLKSVEVWQARMMGGVVVITGLIGAWELIKFIIVPGS